MKIVILTFQFADIYGALLQAYSLRENLIKSGAECVQIINYADNHNRVAYSVNPLKKSGTRGKLVAILRFPVVFSARMKFQRFRRRYLGINTPVTSINSFVEYDAVIVGSDQVWNTDITNGDITYFLPEKDASYLKFAYGASSKNGFVSNHYLDIAKTCLNHFKKISVRENQLKAEIEEKCKIETQVVIDPVFLLTEKDWAKIEKRPKEIEDKYIIFYALQASKKLEKIADLLSNSLNIPIYLIHPLQRKISSSGKLIKSVGPREFLYLIHHAEAVVSNSFHAFAFSVIFNKPIYFKNVKGLSNRIENLIGLFSMKVEKTVVEDVSFTKADETNYERLRAKIADSKEFLNEIILGE